MSNAWLQPIELLGAVAGALGLIVSVPQVVKIRRLGTTEGVSLTTWILMFASFSAWTGYGLRTSSISQAGSNLVAMFLAAWLLSLLLRQYRWRYLLLVSLFLTMITATMTLPVAGMSFLLFLFSLVRWPQAITAIKRWSQGLPLPAVSYLTWFLALSSTTLWGVYAVATGRTVILVASVISATAALLIILATAAANRKTEGDRAAKKNDIRRS